MREIKFSAWNNKKKKWEDSIDITLVDKKKLFVRFYYSIGVIVGQFYLLAKSIHKANKHFSEFDKWFKKAQKEERIEQERMVKKLKIAGKRGSRAGKKLKKNKSEIEEVG